MLLTHNKAKDKRKLLDLLIELKAKEIEEKEYRNFYGNPQEIQVKVSKTNRKIDNFARRVRRSFPELY